MAIDVLLVGFRPGALRACRRLQLAAALLHEKEVADGPAARLAPRRRVALGERGEVERAAREIAAQGAPRAVVGVGEGTVRAAAWARAALGLAGNGLAVAERCTDKLAMKRAAGAAGIACALWRAIDGATRAEELVAELGLPLVLKRARSSGSRGMRIVADAAQVAEALEGRELAEGFVRGREMSLESFVSGGRVLFLNPTEYHVPFHANILPAALSGAELATLAELHGRAVAALGIERGMTHLELFRTEAGAVFGELAARPPGGRIMSLLRRAWGFDPWEALLRVELGESPPFPAIPRRCAGAWVLHPGEGEVESIEGLAAARAVPGVRRVLCRLAPGMRVAPRAGTGQDVGHIEAEGGTLERVARALHASHAALDIRMRAPRAVEPG